MRDQKGITLIALVVTIVVLLILAGITITLVLSDDGIFGKAQEASTAMDGKDVEEQLQLALVNAKADLVIDGTKDATAATTLARASIAAAMPSAAPYGTTDASGISVTIDATTGKYTIAGNIVVAYGEKSYTAVVADSAISTFGQTAAASN